ncbi:uncharacterized protein LOC126979096 [Leptidea sinapis]|uniref:uncharacterized protein LOC126979096 n=1 Tax=Leptidea sinapis TaxID=189913 RepID=UPI0021336A42|nr:uncharacterized protein LOC126979096 [Leptidea sinapis]
MTDKQLISKLANVPLQRPGFDALDMSAPVLVQMNSAGQWENRKPDCLDEERLRAVVQHLVKSRAVSAAQSYCGQCNSEKMNVGGSNYIPVIMMPIYGADECPFDMDCEIKKNQDTEKKPTKKEKSPHDMAKESDKEKDKKKPAKRRVMQRLTNFDLLSQW